MLTPDEPITKENLYDAACMLAAAHDVDGGAFKADNMDAMYDAAYHDLCRHQPTTCDAARLIADAIRELNPHARRVMYAVSSKPYALYFAQPGLLEVV